MAWLLSLAKARTGFQVIGWEAQSCMRMRVTTYRVNANLIVTGQVNYLSCVMASLPEF